jgi:hypothetical protein
VLKLPAVSSAEERNPLHLLLNVMAVVRLGGRLSVLLKETPGRVKSLAVERRKDDPQTQVVLTSRTWSPGSLK